MSQNLQPDPTLIGTVSTPPFAVLPDPAQLFGVRAKRLRTYAAVSPLKPYLDFVAGLIEAQQAVVPALPPVEPPEPEHLERARAFEMPALDRAAIESGTD